MQDGDDRKAGEWVPLAERMRPTTLEDVIGQQHLLGEGRFLRGLIDQGALRSLILWGPPGTGKTTLARLYAEAVGATFVSMSAVLSGVKQVREAIEGARLRGAMEGQRTVVFIDEIHRFNRSQQDALLPHVEQGTITLVGATTENPSFEVNAALLSRARVLQLHALSEDELGALIDRTWTAGERGLGPTPPELPEPSRAALIASAGGDARGLLNTLEVAADLAAHAAPAGQAGVISPALVEEALQKKTVLYDKSGDQHYQVVSAFIKSLRGSDPDAALFWMIRMLEAGEDPLFILRRMVIFASEDIGNADPRALSVAIAATESFRLIGLPEGVLPMTQAATYLATAPKSNAVLMAYGRARKDVLEHGSLPVPRHLVNAATAMMKQMGYGRGYRYPHNYDGHYVVEEYLPDRLRGRRYYEPSESGHEKTLAERLARWRAAGKP